MAQNVVLKASGIYTHPNSLSNATPQGSTLENLNTVIDRNDVIEPRRGFAQYGNSFGAPVVDFAKQLINYKDVIFRHVLSKIQFDSDGNGDFRDVASDSIIEEIRAGLRLKSIEANGNLYLATKEGVKKLSARNRFDVLTQSITNAGGVKALDINAMLNFSTPGFLEPNTKAAYRVLFGYKDLNENLILGSPSASSEVYNNSVNSCFVDISFPLPQGLTNQYFYQVYRTGLSKSENPNIEPLGPGEEFNLVFEENITDADIMAGFITAADITPEDFRRTGTLLYTNPVSGEGILQANERPPFATDITEYKGYTFYGNTSTIQRLNFSVITVNGINGYPDLLFTASTLGTALTFSAAPPMIRVGDTITYNLEVRTVAEVLSPTMITLNMAFSMDLLNEGVFVTREDTFTISDNAMINTIYTFQGSTETFTADYMGAMVADLTNPVTPVDPQTAKYFAFSSASDERKYYVWYFQSDNDVDPVNNVTALSGYNGIQVQVNPKNTVIATAVGTLLTLQDIPTFEIKVGDTVEFDGETRTIVAPIISPTEFNLNAAFPMDFTGQFVTITFIDDVTTVRSRTGMRILEETDDFNVIVSTVSPEIFITCANNGFVNLMPFENIPNFTITKDNEGTGEDAANKKIFLPRIPVEAENGPTVAQQIDQLARSLIRVVNSEDALVAAYYQSTAQSIPGQVLFEGRDVVGPVVSLFSSIGVVFTPTIPMNNLQPNQVTSSNEVRPNRIMFSKFQQPEAVPLVNFIDVGPKDRAINRVIALRDSLFILKEDGIYRLSGDVAPFVVTPFDFSVQVLAPDTAVVLNNQIYALSTQGVIRVTEGGVDVISRPIEDRLLRVIKEGFNYKTVAFGVRYESDRAYHLWLPTLTTDKFATQCYRYNTFTNTWTRWDKNANCGIVNFGDDRLYLGPGDINQIERERKSLTRTDYADRQYSNGVVLDGVGRNRIELNSLQFLKKGDVIVQEQYLTIEDYNRLLRKLDDDVFLQGNMFVNTLFMTPGKDMRNAIENLALKLDDTAELDLSNYSSLIGNYQSTIISITPLVDSTRIFIADPSKFEIGRYVNLLNTNTFPNLSGSYKIIARDMTSITIDTVINFVYPFDMMLTPVVSTDILSFQDNQACYNLITRNLNADPGANFANYPTSEGLTEFEAIVQGTNQQQSTVLLESNQQWLFGPLTQYSAMESVIIYNPQFFGDVSMDKQVREGTAIFEDDNFSTFNVAYASDKFPSFVNTEFKRPGIGDWGQFIYDQNNWGGIAAPIPLRTYVPLEKQRCRFINVKLQHRVAREKYSLFGFSLTFRNYNIRTNK